MRSGELLELTLGLASAEEDRGFGGVDSFSKKMCWFGSRNERRKKERAVKMLRQSTGVSLVTIDNGSIHHH